MWHLTSAYMKCVHGRAGGRTLFITKFLGWIVYQILLPMVLRARESSAITLFKDFETLFAFLLNSLNDHYFGQYLVRLVVFLGDDERIFLLLFETIISQACKYVLRPPKRLTFQIVLFLALSRSSLKFVCLLWWQVTRISLAFGQKQGLVLSCSGLRNSLTVFTRVSAAVLIYFFVSPVRRLFNPWTYTQIHTITVVQEGRGGRWMEPLPGVFDML